MRYRGTRRDCTCYPGTVPGHMRYSGTSPGRRRLAGTGPNHKRSMVGRHYYCMHRDSRGNTRYQDTVPDHKSPDNQPYRECHSNFPQWHIQACKVLPINQSSHWRQNRLILTQKPWNATDQRRHQFHSNTKLLCTAYHISIFMDPSL